ncbi:MAG: GGDEF domain-containing protein, partial [Deltaproteobacteria bacterium]|nr:GGDEF domain-containing protein [Deltaproteobacteria bacterium]
MISTEQVNILDLVRVSAVIIDKEGIPVHINQSAAKLFMSSTVDLVPQEVISQFKILIDPENLKKVDRLNLKINQESLGERIIQAIHDEINDTYSLITLRDISKEVKLIQDYAFNRKELKAKNILHDRKEQENQDLKHRLAEIYDQVPNEIIIIKNDFRISGGSSEITKRAVKKNFNYCYEYLGYKAPCPNCPLKDETNEHESSQVGHEINGQFFLETISPFSSSREILLTFKDTTRQVNIIEEIRQQKETIQSQKELMTDLVDMMALMQKKVETEAITDNFLENIQLKTNSKAVALLILGNKEHDFWIHSGNNFPDNLLDQFVENYKRLPVRKQNIENFPFYVLEQEIKPLHKIIVNDSRGKNLGYLVLDTAMTDVKRQIISLFTDPLTAYLTNQLLLKKLETIAHTDGLTGLYNRYYFKQEFDEANDRFEKFGIHYSLLVADANGLKPVNDNYGHEAGDRFLIEIAECLKAVSRKTDVVARMGGDEFSVLMPDSDQSGGEYLIERIRE